MELWFAIAGRQTPSVAAHMRNHSVVPVPEQSRRKNGLRRFIVREWNDNVKGEHGRERTDHERERKRRPVVGRNLRSKWIHEPTEWALLYGARIGERVVGTSAESNGRRRKLFAGGQRSFGRSRTTGGRVNLTALDWAVRNRQDNINRS